MPPRVDKRALVGTGLQSAGIPISKTVPWGFHRAYPRAHAALANSLRRHLDARFRRAIAAWCARKGMSDRAFGAAALGDPDFVASLGRGRIPRLATADRVLSFMGEAPAGPAFRAEVEAFLAVTGIKRSVLGIGATGNPSFVAHLRRGTSHTLSTVERVRAWMAVHANAAEALAIERRIGTLPEILAAGPMHWRVPPSKFHVPSTPDGGQDANTAVSDEGGVYLNTREAALRLGLSPRTLDRYRVTGEGPVFFRFGRAWCATGGKTWLPGLPGVAGIRSRWIARFAPARADETPERVGRHDRSRQVAPNSCVRGAGRRRDGGAAALPGADARHHRA